MKDIIILYKLQIQLSILESYVKCCETSIRKGFQTVNMVSYNSFKEIWLSWYNCRVCIGHPEQASLVEFVAADRDSHNKIGYIKFNKPGIDNAVEWNFEVSPYCAIPLQSRQIEGGKLHWVHMTSDKLPPDALIGGFDNEPTYIARAYHNNSICPGRFIPSQRVALIPWGFHEHRKQHFEILCGYDAVWVQTSGNDIPLNAFVAGSSEVGGEPLYIGRAMIDSKLLTGKVHVLYKTCYLPYAGKEIEVNSYEVLVSPCVPLHGYI
ncbi:unnamed protein product [Diatraea saccharalis]|uniref:Uncharacterized protein n=1 Tax=Diatraea saccharalis TaxID=40085 RepID=A0A9N9RIA0_9NEOP|nr:unnamed protein product [Diatraea saccharalis]CAG9796783.1 unnamed protein product [Diatraea saccharalis]